MKRAVILHGTSAKPMDGWRPWLKHKLEGEGYEVWAPALPENDAPNMHIYNDFLFESGWDFDNNIVVGHSSGAVAALNLLMDSRCPTLKLVVPVSVWSHGLPTGYSGHAFDNTFPATGYDFDTMRSKVDQIEFLQSDNDPYCPLEQAEYLATSLESKLTVIHTNYGDDGDHLGNPVKLLPELWKIIEPRL